MRFSALKVMLMLALVAAFVTGCPLKTAVTVSVTPLSATLGVGQSLPLTASSTNAADAPFAWSSSNPAVATIDATSGLTVNVTAVAAGVTTITVTGSSSGVVATATIAVPTALEVEPESAQVTVTPSAATVHTGQTVSLAAFSKDSADMFTWAAISPNVTLSAATGTSIIATTTSAGVSAITVTGSHSGTVAVAVISVIDPSTDSDATPTPPGGLNVKIVSVIVPVDNKPEIIFMATTDRGDNVPQIELTYVRFMMAHLVAPEANTKKIAQYVNYLNNVVGQATTDGAKEAGVTRNADGTYTYKFKSALTGVDPAETQAVGAEIQRTCTLDGVTYPANAIFEFRPDGGVLSTRDIVETATCNECHTRMGFHHSGDRREVRLCILCHNESTIDPDTGNSVDMPVMVHKIHMGKDLPSVADTPYKIIGFGGSVHDYSTVAFPQDIKNCVVCHKDGSQSDAWKKNPSLKGCQSCHDRTWFGDETATPAGFTNHLAGAVDDTMCGTCHKPAGPGVMSATDTKHRTLEQQPEAVGLLLDIVQHTVDPVVGTLSINFTAKTKDGAPITDLNTVERIGSVVAWPASEYLTYKSETIQSTTSATTGTLVSKTSPTGEYTYTFKALLTPGSADTFGIQMTGRRAVTIDGATVEQGLESNSLQYFTIDGSDPVARRQPVDDVLCAKCHGGTIRAHGEQRVGVDGCVMCHNASNTDVARRPAGLNPPVTINFKDMLHKIHTGENLSRDYTVYGFGGVPLNANEMRFPGLRQVCSTCHGEYSVNLPLSPDITATTVVDNAVAPSTTTITLPTRATCTSCHDSLLVDIHAALNTDSASNTETCEVCHGEGKAEAVSVVHKLAPIAE